MFFLKKSEFYPEIWQFAYIFVFLQCDNLNFLEVL